MMAEKNVDKELVRAARIVARNVIPDISVFITTNAKGFVQIDHFRQFEQRNNIKV